MIERSLDRRPCGIRAYPQLLMTPPFVLMKPVADRAGERPISIYTALSDLRFVSDEDKDTISLLDSDTNPSPLSPVSQLQFASPEETMTLMTPIESAELPSRESSLPSSTSDVSSSGVREEQSWITPSERYSSKICTTPLQQPGWPIPKLDNPVIPGPMRTGMRPLPEVPRRAQSRPLPPRPTNVKTVPCLPDSNRFSYPPSQEFFQGSSNDPLTTLRPVSDPGYDARTRFVRERQPKLGPAPEDTPLGLRPPAPATTLPPTTPLPSYASRTPPTAAIPTVFSTIPKPDYPAPILLSPTSIDLVTAASLTVTGENGEQILFGALFRDRKVIVIFIRHFFCLFCRDYVRSISNIVTPEILGRSKKGVDLVLIGNGAHGMIKEYKKSLKLPFAMYTDSSLQLHDALGLYKTSSQQPECLRKQDAGRSYVRNNGRWASLRVAVRIAAARAVHMGNSSASLEQLGGEFVFGPGLKSSFVHKMQNARDHAQIVQVLEAAGVEIREKVVSRASDVRSPIPTTPTTQVVDMDIYLKSTGLTPEPSTTSSTTPPSPATVSTGTTSTARVSTSTDSRAIDLVLAVPGSPERELPTPIIEDLEEWMVRRSNSLTRIKEKREARRRGDIGPGTLLHDGGFLLTRECADE